MMEEKETVRSFAAGDVVMRCDPLVWILDSSAYKTRCAYCLRKCPELLTCSRCKLHRYCSAACQSADWKLEHKLECTLLQTANCGNIGAGETAGARSDSSSLDVPQEFIAKLANKIKLNAMMDIPGMGRISAKDLLSMLPANPAQSEIEQTISPATLLAWESENPMLIDVPAADVLTYYGILRYHARSIFDSLHGPSVRIGLAVYPQAPRQMTPVCWDINVELIYYGRRLVIHAVEDIPQYTGLPDLRYCVIQQPFDMTRAERRAKFEKRQGCPCTCRRCTPEYDAEINPLRCATKGCTNRIPSDSRALQACSECGAINGARLTQFHQFMKQHETIITRHPEERHPSMLLQLCKEMDATGILQPDAHIRFVCGRALPQKYCNDGRLEEGLTMINELIGCVRKIYPEYAVFRARLLMSAGLSVVDALHKQVLKSGIDRMSLRLINRLEESASQVFALNMDYCSEARSILVKLFGKQSKEVQEGDADCKQAVMQLFLVQQILRDMK